ncbi:flagellar basal body P-ring formation protein FlgA [candidate division GN15 bacterium]|nr:flagellar basal body P-ring formation protein FlgA [candidate division GN15 bacterium]
MIRAIKIILLLFLVGAAPVVGAMSSNEAICQRMTEMFALDTTRCEIEILSNPLRSADLQPSQVVIRPLTSKKPAGLFTVIADVMRGGEVLESGQVRMRIHIYEDVLVVLDKLRRHDPVSAEVVALERMEVTNLREQPLVSLEALDDIRARRNLRRGDILTTGDVEPVPDVEYGREIKIVYNNGPCTITALGKSLQAGMAGEYIKVRNVSSGKMIIARVVNDNTVAVDP